MTVTNVVVGRKRTIQVSANATGGIIDTAVPVTLKNVPTIATGGVTRLDHLHDVNPSGETQGATLIYDSELDKYNVKKLDLTTDVVGSLDGGTF